MIATNGQHSVASKFLPLSEQLEFLSGELGGFRRGSICCLAGLRVGPHGDPYLSSVSRRGASPSSLTRRRGAAGCDR